MRHQVARLYVFPGVHSVPGLPEPWCNRHGHQYTVEVVLEGDLAGDPPIIADTDILDHIWDAGAIIQYESADGNVDLDSLYGAENTTVEALATMLFAYFWDELKKHNLGTARLVMVSVMEDRLRWGRALR